ncbi:MAG: hypothetical protein ACSLFI_06960 [Solirubrobacterales bacterium]
MSAVDIGSLLSEATTCNHPALTARVRRAQSRPIPWLIVTDGTAEQRRLTVGRYLADLVGAELVGVDGLVWLTEPALAQLEPQEPATISAGVARHRSAAFRSASDCELLVLEVDGGFREQTGDPGTFGYAPRSLDLLVSHRDSHVLPTIVLCGLPVGNPPVQDLSANDPTPEEPISQGSGAIVVNFRGPNMGLKLAVEDRDSAGWEVPSEEGGFDPDAQLVGAGIHSLQVHLGGHAWWRLYRSALATAIDASALRSDTDSRAVTR